MPLTPLLDTRMAAPRPRLRVGSLAPDFRRFERLFDGDRAIPVWAKLKPVPDPLLLCPAAASGSSDAPFLLQSAGPVKADTARYTIASCSPYLMATARGDSLELRRGDRVELRANPIAGLRELLAERPARRLADQPPFAGGAVGFFGYDMGRHFETLPATAVDDLGVADFCLGFYEGALVIDRLEHCAYAAATVQPGSTARETYEHAREAVQALARRLAAVQRRTGHAGAYATGAFSPQFTRAEYEDRVEAVREYIRAGDVFQVNLSHRLSADFQGSAPELYRRLLDTSPAAFAACLQFPGVELISASPERFLHVSGRTIETRPIKGTTRRTFNAGADRRLETELLASDKERAEHVMTVDLLRNDLGRVCEFGTVTVRRMLEAERCPQVIHLVSTIAGRLRHGTDTVDVLRATFPGGSVTGAPKIRAMEIIEELEERRRGPYTGAIGYLAFSGELNLSIAIRTLVRTGDRIHLQVGGGIVADSDPAREYEETMLKARGLVAALRSHRDVLAATG